MLSSRVCKATSFYAASTSALLSPCQRQAVCPWAVLQGLILHCQIKIHGNECVQLILSGQSRHTDPSPASASGTPVSVTCEGNALVGGEQHLRIYHEYLSYLFRKPEPPSPQQQLEMGYRDYLQVSSVVRQYYILLLK